MIEKPGYFLASERLTVDHLPPPNTRRWTPKRKAEVVAAVLGGILTIEEACAFYQLSLEELNSWRTAYQHGGRLDLRASQIQQLRDHNRHRTRW